LTNQTQKFNHNPNNRLQKIQNCAISINWMENLGVDIRFISPHNIVDGSRRAILSCLYAIKRRFTQGEKDPKIFRTTSNKEVDVKRVTNVEITGPGREDEVKKLQKEKKILERLLDSVVDEYQLYKDFREKNKPKEVPIPGPSFNEKDEMMDEMKEVIEDNKEMVKEQLETIETIDSARSMTPEIDEKDKEMMENLEKKLVQNNIFSEYESKLEELKLQNMLMAEELKKKDLLLNENMLMSEELKKKRFTIKRKKS